MISPVATPPSPSKEPSQAAITNKQAAGIFRGLTVIGGALLGASVGGAIGFFKGAAVGGLAGLTTLPKIDEH